MQLPGPFLGASSGIAKVVRRHLDRPTDNVAPAVPADHLVDPFVDGDLVALGP